MTKRYSAAVEEWSSQWDCCWRCGKRGVVPTSLCRHHFVRGSSKSLNAICTLLILCHPCHHEQHNGKSLSLVEQLALKRKHDPGSYDLLHVLALKGWQPGAVTETEVSEATP